MNKENKVQKNRLASMPTFDDSMISFYKEHPEEIETLKQVVLAEYEADKSMDARELLSIFRYIAKIEGHTEFAKRSKISRKQTYDVVSSTANPRFSTLIKLADSCGLRVSFITK